MLYRLLGRAGAVKNCYQREAQKLLASGAWIDITKNRREVTNHANKCILIQEKRREESKHECSERKSAGIECPSNAKTNRKLEVNGRCEGEQSKEGLQGQDVKKKRGRPPKVKVIANAAES